jgi:hypothetical protein
MTLSICGRLRAPVFIAYFLEAQEERKTRKQELPEMLHMLLALAKNYKMRSQKIV